LEAHEQLAARHIALRERAGLTQEQEAKLAGVSPTTISGIESGKITRPHLKTLLKLARALGADVGELRESGKVAGPSSQTKLFNNGVLEEERLETDFPRDRQQWERVLASVRERQSEVEATVEELVELSTHSGADAYEVKWALDEAQDCLFSLMLALPGSHRERGKIRVDNLLAVDPDQWQEVGTADRFYDGIAERLVGAGLAKYKTRAGQKAEPVAVGSGV
jgi:transcriptional regulator with XRE-family HTH domain